jgi:SAM-dependent methyltransferase
MTVLRGDALRELVLSADDAAIEEHLGVRAPERSSTPPGPDLVGYHASGARAVLEAVELAPIREGDVVIDLGAGLGKPGLLIHLLTGARVRGIELQADLVQDARLAIARAALDAVTIVQGDAAEAPIDDGTVFFLYSPFTGPVLERVAERLDELASRRRIVVCTLGIDLPRSVKNLVRRPLDSFWLAIHDGAPC